jgi:putative ABC transport system ATP-binding protein
MSILAFEQVSRVYGRGVAAADALRDVTLTVAPGEFVALVGASGSGKTTLLNLAAGLDRPSSGQVRLRGQLLSDLDERGLARLRRAHTGFVFQTLNLLPTLSAAENISIPLALNGWPAAAQRQRVAELLAAAGLPHRANAFPHELSGGEQQRVAGLRAVAHRPALVLLDEPTSNLDTTHAAVLLELLRLLNEREGTTLLIATHDERIARRTGRTVVLCDGRIVSDHASP